MTNTEQREYWSREGEQWVREAARYDAMLDQFGEVMLDAARLRSGERVLDVGCGNGATALETVRRVAPGGTVVGIDISAPMLALARQRAADTGIGNVEFLRSDAQVHPFQAGTFDAVISRFGTMFFEDPEAAFVNLARTVRSGGRLVIVCWQDLSRQEWIFVPASAAAPYVGLPDVSPPGAPGPVAFADGDRLKRIVETSGFGAQGDRMEARQGVDDAYERSGRRDMRDRLLNDLPVTERRFDLAGVSTSLLEGGGGPPIVLLHGQGGFAAMWGRVIPQLVGTNRLVAPDLPGLGESKVRTGTLDAAAAVAWLGDLIAHTCAEPPIVVGHSLGGTIAAHFAIEHGDRVRRTILVDSGSLGRFRPAPAVILALLRFSARPSLTSHDRFLRQVFVDPEHARAGWGERWAAFEEYHIDRAAQSSVSAANRVLLRRMGVRRIPSDQLRKIEAPVALIWGRNDSVMRFRIAEEASVRFGWPLYPIDDCGHVPHVERPDAFVDALHDAMADR